jgi:hypothetical protein
MNDNNNNIFQGKRGSLIENKSILSKVFYVDIFSCQVVWGRPTSGEHMHTSSKTPRIWYYNVSVMPVCRVISEECVSAYIQYNRIFCAM